MGTGPTTCPTIRSSTYLASSSGATVLDQGLEEELACRDVRFRGQVEVRSLRLCHRTRMEPTANVLAPPPAKNPQRDLLRGRGVNQVIELLRHSVGGAWPPRQCSLVEDSRVLRTLEADEELLASEAPSAPSGKLFRIAEPTRASDRPHVAWCLQQAWDHQRGVLRQCRQTRLHGPGPVLAGETHLRRGRSRRRRARRFAPPPSRAARRAAPHKPRSDQAGARPPQPRPRTGQSPSGNLRLGPAERFGNLHTGQSLASRMRRSSEPSRALSVSVTDRPIRHICVLRQVARRARQLGSGVPQAQSELSGCTFRDLLGRGLEARPFPLRGDGHRTVVRLIYLNRGGGPIPTCGHWPRHNHPVVR